jgi:uncharacterized protein with NRDE domain
MCTLAMAIGTDRRWPLIVAANRDERLGRGSEPWALRSRAGGAAYAAPRDAVAGGTWVGLSAAGVFAAVTNVFTGAAPDAALRSRGELVGLALAHPSAAAARAALAELGAAEWNPFNLAVADARDAFLWRHDGAAPASFTPLAPGLHVVTERAADGQDPRALAVRAAWPTEPRLESLGELLSRHGPGEPVCVHLGEMYGTRSATVLRLTTAVATSDLWTTDLPPCTAPFEDRSELLAALSRLS